MIGCPVMSTTPLWRGSTLTLPGIESGRTQRLLHEVGMGITFSVLTCSHKKERDKPQTTFRCSKANLKKTAERTLSGTHVRLWEFRSFVQLYWSSNVVGIAVVVKQTCTWWCVVGGCQSRALEFSPALCFLLCSGPKLQAHQQTSPTSR